MRAFLLILQNNVFGFGVFFIVNPPLGGDTSVSPFVLSVTGISELRMCLAMIEVWCRGSPLMSTSNEFGKGIHLTESEIRIICLYVKQKTDSLLLSSL